jgi:hypothetical protein
MRRLSLAGAWSVLLLLAVVPTRKVPVPRLLPFPGSVGRPPMDRPPQEPPSELPAIEGFHVSTPDVREPEDPSDDASWEVRIVDGAGLPREGVVVRHGWRAAEEPGCSAVTSPDGRAVLRGFADRGGPDVGRFPVVTEGVVPTEHWLLTEPFTLLRVRHGLPLVVQVVDARSGGLLAGVTAVRLLGRPGTAAILERASDEFRRADSFLLGGEDGSLSLEVDLPPGMAHLGSRIHEVGGAISRFAESLRVSVPAWGEASILIGVVDREGGPVEGARVDEVVCGWIEAQEFRCEDSDPAGRIEVHGIPDLPGEEFRIRVSKGREQACVPPIETDGSGSPHFVEAVMGYRAPAGDVRC